MAATGRKRPLGEYRPEYHQLVRMQWEWMRPGSADWRDYDEIERDEDYWGEFQFSGYQVLPSAHVSLRAVLRERAKEDLEKSVKNGELRQAIQALPGELQDVILPWSRGFTISEISEALGLPWSTISDRLERALKLLRKQFGVKRAA